MFMYGPFPAAAMSVAGFETRQQQKTQKEEVRRVTYRFGSTGARLVTPEGRSTTLPLQPAAFTAEENIGEQRRTEENRGEGLARGSAIRSLCDLLPTARCGVLRCVVAMCVRVHVYLFCCCLFLLVFVFVHYPPAFTEERHDFTAAVGGWVCVCVCVCAMLCYPCWRCVLLSCLSPLAWCTSVGGWMWHGVFALLLCHPRPPTSTLATAVFVCTALDDEVPRCLACYVQTR